MAPLQTPFRTLPVVPSKNAGTVPPFVRVPERGEAAGKIPVAGIEDILAQGDVLAGNLGLPSIGGDDAIIGRSADAPVDPAAVKRQLSGRAAGQPGDQLGDFS